MIDLQKMCLSWATANDCAADWLWLLEQAKDVVNATTVEALFLKKVAAQVPAHCKPTMRRLRDNLLQERMQWVDGQAVELLQKVVDNKVLPNVTKLTKDEARAFTSQRTFRDWALIAKCCSSWIRQSEEFNKQEAWVRMGWKALLIYQVEPMSAARKNTRRHTPVLYRHVPISGGENRAKWLPNGYVSATDDKTLHGWNSVAVILSALALIKYPDSPFYEGPLTDGFWLLKAAQETRVHCTDPLALVAMLEQFNYVVPVKQVRGPDIKIVPVEPANDNKKENKEAEKARKKVESERTRIEESDDAFRKAMDFAITAMAFAPTRNEIAERVAKSRVNGISRLSALGAPGTRAAWANQEFTRGFVPWLGHEVVAERWEFTLGKYSPRAFDSAFIAALTGEEPASFWPDKWEAALISSWLTNRDVGFNSHTAGLHNFEKMQTAEGEMTLWEWYYRMHTRNGFYKTKSELRMKHLYALTQVDILRGSIPFEIKDWLPQSFHKECPIVLLRELGVW